MTHDTPYKAAPGRVLCKILEDVEETEGFLLPDKQMNLVAQVIHVGEPLDAEERVLAGIFKTMPNCRVVLPKLKGQIWDGYIAVRICDINIII